MPFVHVISCKFENNPYTHIPRFLGRQLWLGEVASSPKATQPVGTGNRCTWSPLAPEPGHVSNTGLLSGVSSYQTSGDAHREGRLPAASAGSTRGPRWLGRREE